ncbi:QsdR family transcriptional regulator [Nocardioides limicola]|uniref:QsdR family transcriptional regulator n=1 Tax=Nocardioides limicola TaxID=2803368 RepID=UPI00193B8E54|nr:QsdR family transcriptional regulator [Nocardioides sp. DJM-14]
MFTAEVPTGYVPVGSETRLARRLRGLDVGRTDPLPAFKEARRIFIAGEKLDMHELAATLRIDRATLFRWVGNRDQLLAEVIWSATEPTIHRAISEARGTGAERIADALTRWVAAVQESPFFQAFLRREGERGLRLLTTTASGFQDRLILEMEQLLVAEKKASGISYPLPIPDLAFALARIAEAYIYADIVVGETPNAARAGYVIKTLLGIGPGEDP